MRLRNFLPLCGVVLFTFILGCTRNVETSTVKLTFSRQASAQAVGGKLGFAVVNVQLPSGPIVKNFEFNDDGPASTDTFTIELPDVPRGTFLIQFFGAYEQSDSPTTLVYGFQNANINAAEAVVNISASSVGTFAREGKLSGRYLTSIGPDAGPTGDLVMKYQPPDASQPAITLQNEPIVDGYFSVTVVDGAELNYYFNGEPVFSRIKLDGDSLSIGGVAQATGNNLMRIRKPKAGYRDGNDVKTRPPTDSYVGYFKRGGLAGATKTVCFPQVYEGARGALRPDFSQPMDIDLTGSGSGAFAITGLGGSGIPQDDFYTGTGCPESAGSLRLSHTMISKEEDFFRAPFAPVNPFAQNDNYLQGKLIFTSGPKIRLSWKMMPALNASAISGFAILAKNSSESNGGGRDTCDRLIAQGFNEIATVPAGSTSYDFALSVPVTTDWRFGVCAFTGSASTRQYVGRYIQGGSLYNQNAVHSGWAPSTLSASYGTAFYGPEILQGTNAGARVTAVTASPSSVALTLDATTGLVAGDEVMIHVTGRGTDGDCGVHNIQNIAAGDYDFIRVLKVAGTTVNVAPGSLLEDLKADYLAGTVASGAHFCYAQITKVAQFRDLNLVGTSISGTASFGFVSANGALPIRVNGTLNMTGSSIMMNGVGYAGGAAAYSGMSALGTGANAFTNNGTGGGAGISTSQPGCGGAGMGAGSSFTSICVGGVGPSASGFGPLQGLNFGGGGGGGISSAGAAGGGALFIAARNLVFAGANTISADGVASSGGGSGGGGTVFMAARNISGASSLVMSARGAAAGGGGGAGGGGFLRPVLCNASGGTPTYWYDAGNAGGGLAATNGNIDSSSGSYLCQSAD